MLTCPSPCYFSLLLVFCQEASLETKFSLNEELHFRGWESKMVETLCGINFDVIIPEYLKPIISRVVGLPYKSDADARRRIQIKPVRETNVGVAQA